MKIFNNYKLLLLYFFICFCLTIKFLFEKNGHISNDSSNYLMAAQNFLNNFGFFIEKENGSYLDKELFSSWPVGYPFFIAILSKLISLNVFYSSKILNFIFIGLTIYILKLLFKKNIFFLSVIFLFSSYLEIFSFTWSETGFIFSLVLLCYSISKIFDVSNNNYFYYFLILLFAVITLFLFRYIGLYSIILLLTFYFINLYVNKNLLVNKYILSAIVFNLIFVIFYFGFNYIETGLISGRSRGFAQETNLELLVTLIQNILAEITIPVYHPRIEYLAPLCVIQFSLLFHFFYKYEIHKYFRYDFKIKNIFKTHNIFLFTGLSYMLSIITARWIFYFNDFSFRLLGPGTFLIFIWLFQILYINLPKDIFKKFKNIVYFLTLISVLLYVPIKSFLRYDGGYLETVLLNNIKYKKVNEGDVIIFDNNKHLKYLRSDLKIKSPLPGEKPKNFFKRLNIPSDVNVYLDIDQKHINKEEFSAYIELIDLKNIQPGLYKINE